MKSILSFPLLFVFSLVAEIPPSTLSLMPPMTEIYHPVSTTNVEAQQNFDKGLTYLFAYNHDLSFSSFQKAADLDPNLAMAYWGMSLALGQNVNVDVTLENELKCYNYIQKALQLSSNVSQNEKEYILAATRRYTNDIHADLISLRSNYREAMKKVVANYPEDLDAATLYAESILNLDPWRWWSKDGKPLEGTMEAIEKLEFVLSRNPFHVGANHFYIHAWEESPTPQRALTCAYRLESLLPESGHLLHMPCHIFLLVGDYESAVKTSKNAIVQDRAYYEKVRIAAGTYPIHYMTHNLSILARTYMLMEDYEKAIATSLEMVNFIKPFFNEMPHFSHFAIVPLEIYLYFDKWHEILEYSNPSDLASMQAYWHYSRAKAFIFLGNMNAAQKEEELMLKYKGQIGEKEMLANNPAIKVIDLAQIDLKASYAHIEKKPTEYINLLNQAIALEDELYYDEPPAWYISLRIPLGAALIEQKRYSEGEAAFQKVLSKLQRNGRALYGLFLSLKGQNRTIDAYWIEREMTAALKHASQPLKLKEFFP